MQEELHVFIIWSKALFIQQELIEDLSQHLEIRKVYKCHWDKNIFAFELYNFYHKHLRRCCRKERECGNEDFIVIVANDKNPRYDGGVNATVSGLKRKYRLWTKERFLIHASDTAEEAEDNLKFLTNLTCREFFAKYPHPWDNKTIDVINFPARRLSFKQKIKLAFCRLLSRL